MRVTAPGLFLALGMALGTQPGAAQASPATTQAPWSIPALSRVPTPSWLALSGEVRLRMESRDGLGYRPGVSDTYLLIRTRLNVDVRPHALVRLSLQGQDAHAPGILSTNATGVFRDPFDLRQAHLRVGRADAAAPFAVTIGRQLLNYGDQRIIGPLDWTNTARAFDAAKVEIRSARFDVDVFSAAVVQNDPTQQLNEADFDNQFHGVYGRVRAGTAVTIEPFALWRATPTVGAVPSGDRYSVGSRVVGRFGRLESAVTYVEQWGERGTSDIEARALLVAAGYTLAAPMAPRLYGEYNYASGDSDPSDQTLESFDDVYSTAHLYYGYNDLVGLRNLHNIRAGVSLTPWRRLNVALDFHTFSLASERDHFYNAPGTATVQVPSGGAAARRLGEELDFSFTMPVAQTLVFSGGVGRFFPGPFVEANTQGAANTFTYTALSMRF